MTHDPQPIFNALDRHIPAAAPAAQLCVYHRGAPVLNVARGVLDPAAGTRPVTTETRFDLASVTKLFVVTAFMRLVEQGAVALDQPVATVLPAFSGVRPILPYEDPLNPGAWVDVTPTALDVCGVVPKPSPPVRPSENIGRLPTGGKPQPYQFHGRSIQKVVGLDHAPEFNQIFGSHTFHEVTMYYPMRTVIRGKYKLIWNIASPLTYPLASDLYASPTWQGILERKDSQYGSRSVERLLHRPPHELYDLEADPDELQNLADRPDKAALLKELQETMKTWQKQTRDPWISKWEYE